MTYSLYYILAILSFGIALAYHLKNTRRWLHLIYMPVFLLFLTAAFILASRVKPYSVRGTEYTAKEVILLVCIFAGIASSTILQKLKRHGNGESKIRALDVLMPLGVSPIVFLVISEALDKMADFNLTKCCFAYTSGYFWRDIMSHATKIIRGKMTGNSGSDGL